MISILTPAAHQALSVKPALVQTVVPVAPPTYQHGLKMADMTLFREGEVKWWIAQGLGVNHCGTSAAVKYGRLLVRYKVSVVCAPTLDAQGFLFDQTKVDTFFRQLALTPTPLSCEELTTHAANRLLTWLASAAPTCQVRRLALTLSPDPFKAALTATFESPL